MKKRRLSALMANGIIKQNPTFRLALGMCPTLAVTTLAVNGLGMGLATLISLVMSNVLISLLRKVIPDKVRIPAYILIIATAVTAIEMVMGKFLPDLYAALGVFIPLIVVNCIIFARAESFAAVNPVLDSAADGIAIGLGFTVSLTLVGILRELLSLGSVFGLTVLGDWFPKFGVFALPAGGFLMLGLLMAAFNAVYTKIVKNRSLHAAAVLQQDLALQNDMRHAEDAV